MRKLVVVLMMMCLVCSVAAVAKDKAAKTSDKGGSSMTEDAGGASLGGASVCGEGPALTGLPEPGAVLATLHLTNEHLLQAWPDPRRPARNTRVAIA